jgi:glutathionylspermidine synthase
MQRRRCNPRPNWQQIVESQGLTFHTTESGPYWDESAFYTFSAAEIDVLEQATNELQEMCLKAAQHIIDNQRYAELCIPSAAIPAIEDAWERERPSIYGRFDLAFDGVNPPQMLEYNANTPTSLIEAAVIQWHWLNDVCGSADQFNSIHEKLIAQWKEIRPHLNAGPLYFTGTDDREDAITLAYLQDTAGQAGIAAQQIAIGDIGWNERAGQFRDLDEREIGNVFALYPWEWLLAEYPDALLRVQSRAIWIEPIWKMLWSNKALLAILWELFPGHPNLLEARRDGPGAMRDYVRKPLLSREGANVLLKTGGREYSTGGDYGEEGFVWQADARIPCFDGRFPVIGSWVVTDQGACGIGIRESDTPITDNLSRFVPHCFQTDFVGMT